VRKAGESSAPIICSRQRTAREFFRRRRIQFTKTDKKKRIFNGAAGTIEAIDGCHIAVHLDGRETKTISFNAGGVQ